MRSGMLWSFVLVVGMISLLLVAIQAHAGREAVEIDGQTRSLEFSTFVVDQLNYQGYLIDAADSSAFTATLEMTFRLFDSETKGVELWSETHSMVEVSNGLFHVLLGSLDAFPTGLFDGAPLWLQTEIGSEMLMPRKLLASVAYSQKAGEADHAATADFAADAQQAVHADTADYVPGVSAWTVSGDDIYRQTGKVGIGTASPLTELDVAGAVNATTYYGDGSNLTGVSGTADADWTVSGSDMYSGMAGNVGIGTATPFARLEVKDSTGLRITSGSHDNCYGNLLPDYGTGRGGLIIDSWTGGTWADMSFQTNGTTRMFLESGGNVGIGTESPGAGFHVKGDEYPRSFIFIQSDSAQDAGIRLYSGDTVKWHIFNSATDDDGLRIYNSSGAHTVFFADQEDGDVGIGTTTPEGRLHVIGGSGTLGYMGHDDYGVMGASGIGGNWGFLGGSTYGLYAYHSGGGTAGHFAGNLYVSGSINKSACSFLIDHPLDPENKLLRHTCVESPENLLIYRGKVRLDTRGEGVVEMPQYFKALAREEETTITLTPIGRPFLVGYEWLSDQASFRAYGEPNREVSWVVYADRDDPVIQQLRRPVEEDKGPENKLCDQGQLLHPTAYGYPESMGKDYKEREEMKWQMEEREQ